MVRLCVHAAVAAIALLAASCANAGDLLDPLQIRDTMARVETLLHEHGVNVAGYAASAPPTIEFAHPSHAYLQGSDGGFADGRIYVSNEAIEACVDLIVLHELVHDATIKHRLFAAVPNERVKDAIEALADAITAAAAETPYRPGCLPRRHFAWGRTELAKLAMAAPGR
jgi:hypothetical protein